MQKQEKTENIQLLASPQVSRQSHISVFKFLSLRMHDNSVLYARRLQSFKQNNIYWHLQHNSFVCLIPRSLRFKLKDHLLNFHSRTYHISVISRRMKHNSRPLSNCFESGAEILKTRRIISILFYFTCQYILSRLISGAGKVRKVI